MDVSSETIFWTHAIGDAALSQQAVVLWLDLDDPAIRPLTELPATEEDVSRAAAYGVARTYFLARRAVLRHFIARRLGCAAEAVAISTDSSGAPVLSAPRQSAELFLSISGRGAFAAFAIASRPIGVDIEILGPAEDVPMAMLHANEAARLAGLDPASRHKAFLEIWTVKEAYLKALRIGLSREPSEIEVRFEEESGIRLFDAWRPVTVTASASRSEGLGGETLIAACVVA